MADIDFLGDGNPDTTGDNIDLSSGDGNFDPIGTVTGTSFPAFTGRFHGNGHAISHLDIQHSYTASDNSDLNRTRVGLFTNCRNVIQDLFVMDPTVTASRTGGRKTLVTLDTGVICGANGILRNVHVRNATLNVSTNRFLYIGTLIGNCSSNNNSIQYSSSLEHSISATIMSGSLFNAVGGLVGHANGTLLIIASRSDGALSIASGTQTGGILGGLVGSRFSDILELVGSYAGGSISNESTANQTDSMGGLIGTYREDRGTHIYFRLYNSLSTVQICDGTLSGSACAAGAGNDRVGALIGSYGTTANSIVENNLAIGLTEGLTAGNGDSVGFFGYMFDNVDDGETAAEVTTALNAAIIGNYYDSAVTTLGQHVGVLPAIDHDDNPATDAQQVMNSDLTGIRSRTTTQLQVTAPATTDSGTAAYVGWDTNRWYFKDASSYPEPRYYDYDWDHDGDSGTAAISIDICEDITPNDPEVDQGSPLKPDCGDKLSAFPREPAE